MIWFSPYLKLNILYEVNTDKAYLLNEEQNLNKISELIKYNSGSFSQIMSDCSLHKIFYYILELSSMHWELSVSNAKSWVEDNSIKPNKISKEQLKKIIAIEPEITVRSDKTWTLAFISFRADGSILQYSVLGRVGADGFIEIEKIESDELYSKGTVKVFVFF